MARPENRLPHNADGDFFVDDSCIDCDTCRSLAPAELGGLRTVFLARRDDVADHAVFRREFGCDRVLHRADMSPATADIERPIEGDSPVALAPDLLAIPVPGHTAGSTALLYDQTFL